MSRLPPSPAAGGNLLEILFQHVCLPPNLPGHFNATERLDRALIDRLIAACRTVKERDIQHHEIWDNLRRGLEASRTLNWQMKLDAKSLSEQFARLNQNDFIILRVAEQNAGLFVHRQEDETGDKILLDSFEASPSSEQVLAADLLAVDFPTSSVVLPHENFLEMRKELAEFLDQASSEPLREFVAKTFKAGTSSRELRDSTNPALVTEVLSTILEANGARNHPSLIRKHIRDDVCWKNAERPWRRSPMWLILRVAIQSHLMKRHGADLGRFYYKSLLAVSFAGLLSDWIQCMSPDSIAFARSKFGRRIAKLDQDSRSSPSPLQSRLCHVFRSLESLWSRTLQSANGMIEREWSKYKRTTKRQIPQLSQTAEPRALQLSLPNSSPHLDQVLREWHTGLPSVNPRKTQQPLAMSVEFSEFIEKNLTFAKFEKRVRDLSKVPFKALEPSRDTSEACVDLSSQIRKYLDLVAESYDFDPLQKSQMILTVFDLWVQMDRRATCLYPTLLEYHTGFSAGSLDVLLLPDYEDMERLQRVQEYISRRNEHCDNKNPVFHNPRKNCFAERYFECTPHLQEVFEEIQDWSSEQQEIREADWREKSAQYEKLSTEIAGLSCIYVVNDDDFGRLMHAPSCHKCYKERVRRKLRIDIFEEPLPSDSAVAKAIVFELCCPLPLAAYRDSTWLISAVLGRVAEISSSTEPKMLLRDYATLKRWNRNGDSHVTLASSTKSFRQTHYESLRLPVDLDEVFKRSGHYFSYYDSFNKIWLESMGPPTFSRGVGFLISPSSGFSTLRSLPQFAPGAKGPSSYEIVASQAACPPNLSAHEYIAFQSLFSSKLLRWHCILLELASSNLNFSEAPSQLCSYLANQAGPNRSEGALRDFHRNFHDETFCHRLLHQIEVRMRNIRANWRENHSMDMLLTLLLRIWAIRRNGLPEDVVTPILVDRATYLLSEARNITLEWISLLQHEAIQATSVEASQVISQYAFWSAILCRRTYTILVGADVISTAILSTFFRVSITLRDNLPPNIFKQPHPIKSALRRDVKLVFRLQPLLRNALGDNPQSFLEGLDCVLPLAEGAPLRSISSTSMPKDENDFWFQVTLTETQWGRGQVLRYHLLQGILLVDNEPVGKLPQEHLTSATIQRLFGSINLRTATSPYAGMQYQILQGFQGHVVHLGNQNGSLIARAYIERRALQYVPPEVFRSNSTGSFDLPAPLIDGCVHWLDLNAGVIEIRLESHKWDHKLSTWNLNLQTRQAWRRESVLVDPQSFYFQQLASILGDFEHPNQLVVHQKNGRVHCEIRRMSLFFNVNRQGNLHCRQYGVVDRSQDIGTWYGLASKLVLKDVASKNKRFVLVPYGQIRYKTHGVHVSVIVQGNGSYLTYTINEIIGRIDCPAEPNLVYAKAVFHALTSFPVPDPLTGRTGTEEAIEFLTSGICQPWAPLRTPQSQFFGILAQLSPRRQFYPPDIKVMQTIHWNSNLPVAVQHEAFRFIVDSLCQVSKNLAAFALQKPDDLPKLEPNGDLFLSTRARIRRAVYERTSFTRSFKLASKVKEYAARKRREGLLSKLHNIVSLIRHRTTRFKTTRDLVQCLQRFPVIGGFDRTYDKTLLSCFQLDFELEWGSLARLSRNASDSDRNKLMFFFALLLYAQPAQEELIYTMLAYSLMDEVKRLPLPPWPSYVNFHPKLVPTTSAFVQLIMPFRVPYVQPESTGSVIISDRRMWARLEASQRNYQERVENDARTFAELLVNQWPSEFLSFDNFSSDLIRIEDATSVLVSEWDRLIHNRHLLTHLQNVQQILDAHTADSRFSFTSYEQRPADRLSERTRNGETRDLSTHLLGRKVYLAPGATIAATASGLRIRGMICRPRAHCNGTLHESTIIRELQSIMTQLNQAGSNVYQKYSMALSKSVDTLTKRDLEREDQVNPYNSLQLDMHIGTARQVVEQHFRSLCDTFTRNDPLAKWLQLGGLWPSVTTATLLQQLRSVSTKTFGPNMKELLTAWAVSITALQRLLRIEDAYRRSDTDKVRGEVKNEGHENWSPLDMPDWLLLEIDSNILLRSSQVDVAFETISPRSSSNSVLQMNMGQGKTSCVIPMAAVVLANKKQLVRVVVPKALLLQTAQLLQSRVGGLLGRHITHVPFARKTSTSPETTNLFGSIHAKTMRYGGIVLALPEHMLSFSLSGFQRLTESRLSEAKPLVNGQSWLQKVSRDIMDESDFILACRTQLIYPSGSQVSFDGGNHRWEAAEILLDFVRGHLWDLQNRFRSSIEVVQRRNGYPIIYFLRQDVQNELLKKLTENICSGHFPLVPTRNCTPLERDAIRSFLTDPSNSTTVLRQVSCLWPDKPAVRNILYLLRGLLVHRILLMALSRRWNVQYGLHPERDPVAVPYTAKGVPSESAEWGHPDVCILFTILSFYYSGLTSDQVRQTLEYILKSDDPAAQYEAWTWGIPTLPDSMREIFSINPEDANQMKELSGYLQYHTSIIDCFLNAFVFPRHAKQFERKLQASGWDLPLFALNKDQKSLTTGFSGTNDNRDMLPLNIEQHDLPSLSHTNAEVLTYLLQPRNRRYFLAAHGDGRRLTEVELLGRLKLGKIRILIDAGAQVLELDNLSLVRQWLQVDHEAPAAVYFDSGNKAMVVYRNEAKVPLVASPFAENLGDALLYLDEAHTRGTDLKLPKYAVAGLTLGLGQTKDSTVQAAMRCRELGTTQSVVWIGTPEVHQSLSQVRPTLSMEPIDSRDIILWLLSNTCTNISQLQPLYYAQGVNFCERMQALFNSRAGLLDDECQRRLLVDVIQSQERMSLEELYYPRRRTPKANAIRSFIPELGKFRRELEALRKDFKDTGGTTHPSALQEVEQEREVAYEVEAVRQVQRPARYKPLAFVGLSDELALFASTGKLLARSSAYENAFSVVQRMALRDKHRLNTRAFKNIMLFCSTEFSRTVQEASTAPLDHLQRNINWVLWSPVSETAIVVIPEEAESLLPIIRNNDDPACLLLTYSAPTTRKMLAYFNDLTFYSVPAMTTEWKAPRWLTISLGLLAGRLYFDFDEYQDLINFLGVQEPSSRRQEVNPPENESTPSSLALTNDPLVFLQDWLAIRRNGQDFTNSPMGFVCQGKTLTADHPFFTEKRATNVQGDVQGNLKDVNAQTLPQELIASSINEANGQIEDDLFDEDEDFDYDLIEDMEVQNDVQDETEDDEIEFDDEFDDEE